MNQVLRIARGFAAAVILAIGAAASAVLSAPAFAGQSDLRPGRAFPQLFLPSLDGKGLRSVASFRGKKLVLHVFASW
jgi:hypothetical protein